MKKICLLFILLIAFGGGAVFAERLDLPGRLTLVSFNESTLSPLIKTPNLPQISQSAAEVYDGAPYSMEWTLPSGEFEFGVFSGVSDWKQYKSVKIRVYSEYSGNKFNLVFMPGRSFASGKYNQFKVEALAGWNEISIPVSSLGTFFTNSPDYNDEGYILVNLTGWSNTEYTPGHKIYFDRIYLRSAEADEFFQATGADIENGADFVPVSLDGNNTFNINFSESLWDTDYTDAVSVYENIAEILSGASFSTSVNAQKLSVIFDNPLTSGVTYYIILKKEKIYSQTGKTLENSAEFNFTVGAATPFFRLTGSNGGKTETGYDYTVSFNNGVGDIGGYLSVYKKNVKIVGGFSITASSKSLTMSLKDAYSPDTEYKIAFHSDFEDIYGNKITGEKELDFKTPPEDGGTGDFVMFSAGDSADLAAAGGVEAVDGNVNLYTQTAKISFNAGADKTAILSRKHLDASVYNYVNYWVYSPEISANKVNLVIYSSRAANTYFRGVLSADWQGWRLVSLELSDFGANGTPVWTDINETTFNINGWGNTWAQAGYFLVDKMWFSAEKPAAPKLLGYSYPLGYDRFPVSGGVVDFFYDAEILTPESGVVTLIGPGGNEISDFTVMSDEKILTVNLGRLDAGVSYILKINVGLKGKDGQAAEPAASYAFKTADGGLSVKKPVFASQTFPEKTGSAEVVYNISNIGTDSAEAAVYLALYNVDGLMLALKKSGIALNAGETRDFQLSSGAAGEAVSARAFVTDAQGNLISEYAALGAVLAEERPIYNETPSAPVDLSGCTFENGLFTVSGGARNSAGAVLVTVMGTEGDTLLKIPLDLGNDGKFIYYFLLGQNADSGVYTVSAVLDGKTAKKQIIYLSETDRANILSAVNSGTVNEIIEILNRYKTNFELTQTDSVISGIAGVIHARKPYASWTALVSEINYAVSTLDGLNKRVWSNLTDFLKNNPVIIDGTDADYIYYKALAQKEQNLINQKIIKALPFDSFEIFRTVFSASVAEYKTETSQNNSDNGKGGFTGSSGGGGSSFGFDKSITGFLRETPIEAAEIFNDLAFAEWARESVTALYEAGVISKAADKKFRPLDNVTREEFVKILVLSLGLSPGADFAVFSDTENGAWYNAYINAAKENGIVNGYPDGTFGTGLEITREDMAVMAFRAASVLGKSLNSAASEAAEFTDGNEISDYARDAVSLMKAAGILSGMGDGGFAPKETATRAQAAKMAASLISAVKGE